MASILSVEQLRGLSSGDNPNTITLPTGQTLDFSAGTLTMPAGHVIQVVNEVFSGEPKTSSTTFVDTGWSITITPTSSSSKIFITVNIAVYWSATNRQAYNYFTLYRNGTTNLGGGSQNQMVIEKAGSVDTNYSKMISFNHLDSPSTTSPVTYNLYYRVSSGEVAGGDGRIANTITAMEISG